jgi:predicted transport protein
MAINNTTFNSFIFFHRKSKSAPSIKPILEKNNTYQEISKEIKVYSEEDHLQGKSDEIIELYEKFKNAILNLREGIEIVYRKLYIGFKFNNGNISDIEIQAKQLKLYVNVNKGQLDDPKGLMRDISSVGHWGNGDYQVIVKNDDDLEYIMSLIKQAIK